MKYLITGGAGFIGSNYLNYVVNKYKKDYFVCLDSLTYAGNYNNIKSLVNKNNFKFIKGDIRNKELIDKLFKEEQFDYVINFAAESNVDTSITDPEIFISTNVFGTMTLLNASKKYNIKRFHQISTDEVYGDLPLDNPNLSFDENSRLNPSNPYSVSKASADMLVLAYHRTYNLPFTISRSSNNFGPNQYIDKLIPLTITNALKNKQINIHGTGEYLRDWIYVQDNVIAIDLIIRKSKDNEIYNIAGNNELKNIYIIKNILKQLNKPTTLLKYTTNRPGQDKRYKINTSKIEKLLNFKPTYNFENSLKKTIEWYKNNL